MLLLHFEHLVLGFAATAEGNDHVRSLKVKGRSGYPKYSEMSTSGAVVYIKATC